MRRFITLLFILEIIQMSSQAQCCLPESIKIYRRSEIIQVPSQYPTIQQGIDAATDGDTVLVDTGLYSENINFHGKKIIVASLFLASCDTSFIANTIIDGNQKGCVVTFEQGEDSTSTLAGFTIINGFSDHGGGIHCSDASPLLSNLVVKNNEAGYEGGGIYLFESEAHIINSCITSNHVETAGGGIICFYSNPVLENVCITDNYAHILTGGIHLEYSSPVIINSLIAGNYADRSGGIGSYTSSHPQLINVTISNNAATIFQGGGLDLLNSDVALTNAIIWGNTPEQIYFEMAASHNSISISYTDIDGGLDGILTNDTGPVFWLEGNIDNDPIFSDTGENPFSLSEGSPCIDAGTPDTTGLDLPLWDIIGNYRIWDGNGDGIKRIDMGAYEFGSIRVGIKSPSPIANNALYISSYPNPFNEYTTIEYELNETGDVLISIYSQFGEKVYLLVNEKQEKGRHKITWNPENLPAGIYFYRLAAGNQSSSGKLVMVK
jgi:hypothetical protein